jgi:Tol biopolymer transport system component
LTSSAEPRLAILQIPGQQSQPSLSPDGGRLVFSWTDQETAGLGIAGVDGRNPRWLTRNRADCCARWSPDGRWIAFGRKTGPDQRDVILVAPDRGPERVIARMEGAHLSWTTSSKQVSIVRRAHPDEPLAIFLVDVETGVQQRESGPPYGYWGDIAAEPVGPPFAWMVARYESRGNGRLWLHAPGKLQPLTHEPAWITSPVANPEGTEVYFRAEMRAGGGIWRIPADASAPATLIPMLKGWFGEPSISRSQPGFGAVFAASIAPQNFNIWQMRLRPNPGAAEPLLAATASEETPALSADGELVAYRTNISGETEIWQAAADGSRGRVLVRPGAKESRSPRYSPDGKLLAFVSHELEARVYVADVSSGRFQRLTQSEREENLAGMVAGWPLDLLSPQPVG